MTTDEDGFGEEPNDPTSVTEKQLFDLIDRWLADARPERYEEEEDDWMEPVVELALEAQRRYRTAEQSEEDLARRRVRSREGQAVKRGHTELRKIGKGEVPLGWPEPGEEWPERLHPVLFEFIRLPFKIGGRKTQLRVMSEQDWRDWRLASQQATDDANQRAIDERRAAERLEYLCKEQNVERTDEIRWAA